MKLLLSIPAAVALFMLSTGCSSKSEKQTDVPVVQEDTVQVAVMTVEPDTFTVSSLYYGRLEPVKESKLICYSGGNVQSVAVKEGAYVKAGSSLAVIDTAKAKTLLQTARLQEKVALKNYEQTKKHLTEGNASQLAVDQSHLAYLGARNSTIDAEKNYRGALATTPLSGTVIFRFIEPFQELPPGSPTFIVAQTRAMKVVISLIESDASQITNGTKASVTTPGTDGVFTGTVTSMALQANESDKTFRTQITVSNPDNVLRSGATAKVMIELHRYTDALCIPTPVISNDGVQHSVMVCSSENKAVRRIITPGAQSDSTTMITEGLLVGDRLIVSGQQLVSEGSPVRITER
jgi:membrane fusion protein, multidrug efflux system